MSACLGVQRRGSKPKSRPASSILATSPQAKIPWESLFHTLLALPFHTPGCAPHTGQMTLLSGRTRGTPSLGGQCPRVLTRGPFQGAGLSPTWDFEEQWPTKVREHAPRNPLPHHPYTVNTSDSFGFCPVPYPDSQAFSNTGRWGLPLVTSISISQTCPWE